MKQPLVRQTWAGWRNNGGGLVIAIDHGNGITTVYNHLAKGIECGEVSLNEVVRLQPQQLDSIRFAIEQSDSGKRLKPVFDALEGEYSYEILRCVRSDMAR